MLKGVVTEVKNGKSTVLTKDWTVINIKGVYEVGSEIELTDEMVKKAGKTVSFTPKRLASAAAAILIVATLGAGTYSTTAVAATSVSIETEDRKVTLDVNYLGYVIDVSATGEGGKELAKEIKKEDIRFRKCPDAVDNITRRMKDKGMMGRDDRPEIGINKVPGDKEGERLKKEMEKRGYEVEKKYKPDIKPDSQPGGEIMPGQAPE